jgi:hypothetical protein
MRVLLLISTLGFLASAGVHFATFWGVAVQEQVPFVWALHVAVMFLAIPAIAAGDSTPPKPFPSPALRAARRSRDWRGMEHAPRWMRVVLAVAFAYTFVNFALFLWRVEDGSPKRAPGGGYELRDGGKLVRAITADEYHWRCAHLARGFSGHWMLFYWACACMFTSALAAHPAPAAPPAPATHAEGFPPVPLGYGRASPRLTIWHHTTLRMIGSIAGFLLPPLLVALGLGRLLQSVPGMPCVVIPAFFASAFVGQWLAYRLVDCALPARCPACRGRAYCDGGAAAARYVCRDCGYAHVSAAGAAD